MCASKDVPRISAREAKSMFFTRLKATRVRLCGENLMHETLMSFTYDWSEKRRGASIKLAVLFYAPTAVS